MSKFSFVLMVAGRIADSLAQFGRRSILTAVVPGLLCLGYAVQADAQESQQELAKLANEYRRAMADSRFDDAITVLDRCLELEPDRFQLRLLRGEARFIAGKMKDCINDFDAIIEADADRGPYLWQRGLALYYAEEYKLGVAQFETHQQVNSQDVENAVWHFLCQAKLLGIEKARAELIPIERDTRVPMKQIHDLFAGTGTVEDVFATVKKLDRSRQVAAEYYANLYVGLYFDAMDDQQKSLRYIQLAANASPYSPEQLMGQVAAVHLKLRKK